MRATHLPQGLPALLPAFKGKKPVALISARGEPNAFQYPLPAPVCSIQPSNMSVSKTALSEQSVTAHSMSFLKKVSGAATWILGGIGLFFSTGYIYWQKTRGAAASAIQSLQNALPFPPPSSFPGNDRGSPSSSRRHQPSLPFDHGGSGGIGVVPLRAGVDLPLPRFNPNQNLEMLAPSAALNTGLSPSLRSVSGWNPYRGNDPIPHVLQGTIAPRAAEEDVRIDMGDAQPEGIGHVSITVAPDDDLQEVLVHRPAMQPAVIDRVPLAQNDGLNVRIDVLPEDELQEVIVHRPTIQPAVINRVPLAQNDDLNVRIDVLPENRLWGVAIDPVQQRLRQVPYGELDFDDCDPCCFSLLRWRRRRG
jgi:hypothetical protein